LVALGDAAGEIEAALEESGLKDHCKSEFNLLKAHETGQLPLYVMLFEEAIGMSAEAGENSHKQNVSNNYRHTNKVDPLKDMTRYHQLKMGSRYVESLDLPDEDEEDEEDNVNENENADDGIEDDGDDVDDADGDPVKTWKIAKRHLVIFPPGDIPQNQRDLRPGIAVLPQALLAFVNPIGVAQEATQDEINAIQVSDFFFFLQ